MQRLAGALADRYTIERELGAGGMATVYLASDLKHDRQVAIKVLKPELAAVLGAERFVVEIKTTAALQHPHILPLFDSGTADGFLFYVMPYIQGETLRTKLDRETQFGIDEAVRITRDVADALDYAHRHGVIHRDIKPENILLHDGRPMVADFGIALALSAAAGGRMTETGMSLGTPHYMSPEQATAEKEITARSDVYSLGSVLYEMLTGNPPHTGASAQQIIMKIIVEPVAPVTTHRKSVPPNVAAAVAKSLEKLPADRFESAKAFADALGNPAYTHGVSPTGKGASRTSAARRAVPLMIAITAAALLVAVWALATRPTASPTPVTRVGMELPDSVTLIASGMAPRLAISHDGAHVVFAGRVRPGSPSQLWLRARDQLQAQRIPGTEGASAPFFSPDGTRIGFFVGATLRIVGLGGEPPLTVADTGVDIIAATAAWGADNAIYVGDQRGLLRMTANGASRTRVSTPSENARVASHRYPDPLPNGRGVLFTIVHNPDNRIQLYEIAVVDLKTGKQMILGKGVMGRYDRAGHLLVVRADGSLIAAPFDQETLEVTGPEVRLLEGIKVSTLGAADLALDHLGTLLYVRSRGTGGAEVAWADRDGRMTSIPATWPATIDLEGPSISPDGRRVAVGVVTPKGSDIWVKQLDNGQQSRLTLDETNNSWPKWSPDGQRVIYSGELKGGHRVLLARRADGNGESEVLINESRAIFEGFVSRDGAWTIYRTTYYERGRADIMGKRAGDSTFTPLVATEADERHPALSPNGRWLAYRSSESGRAEIYVRPFPNVGDDKVPVSKAGGSEPVWSHSGTELFYINAAGALESATVETQGRFAVHEQRVLFSLPDDVRRSAGGRMYDVSADDRRFLMVRGLEADRSQPDRLVLITNWIDELKAKMAVKK